MTKSRKTALALSVVAVLAAPMTLAGPFGGPSKLASPSNATSPSCQFGFQTQQKTSWLLICRKIVPPSEKRQARYQASHANCNVNSYWNYGPKPKVLQDHPSFYEIQYTCGHVEG